MFRIETFHISSERMYFSKIKSYSNELIYYESSETITTCESLLPKVNKTYDLHRIYLEKEIISNVLHIVGINTICVSIERLNLESNLSNQ